MSGFILALQQISGDQTLSCLVDPSPIPPPPPRRHGQRAVSCNRVSPRAPPRQPPPPPPRCKCVLLSLKGVLNRAVLGTYPHLGEGADAREVLSRRRGRRAGKLKKVACVPNEKIGCGEKQGASLESGRVIRVFTEPRIKYQAIGGSVADPVGDGLPLRLLPPFPSTFFYWPCPQGSTCNPSRRRIDSVAQPPALRGHSFTRRGLCRAHRSAERAP